MNTRHLQLLETKYQKLTKHLKTLLRTGRFNRTSLSRRISLTKRWLRYYTRLVKWRPTSVSTLGIGLYMLLTSSTCHHFTLSQETTPYGLFAIGMNNTPTFADIDGDGDLDAFVGELEGGISFFLNEGSSTAGNFQTLFGSSPFGLSIVGGNSAPTFADIDGDGDLDAFIGETDGNINFFRNNPSGGIPSFSLEMSISPFGLSDVGNDSAPTFVDIDRDGDLDAFIGEYDGSINFFRNDGTSLVPNFIAEGGTSAFGLSDVGTLSKPTFADVDGDGDLDAFIGNGDGEIKFFGNSNTSVANFLAHSGTSPFGLTDVGSNSAPAFADIDGDGDLDAFIGEYDMNLNFFAGTSGDASFDKKSQISPMGLSDVGDLSTPSFADIDGDGDLDALIGEQDGIINFFRNAGSFSSPNFTLVAGTSPFGLPDIGAGSAPSLVDINGDGNIDVFIGNSDGTTRFFRNDGTPFIADFTSEGGTSPFNIFDVGLYSAPTFVDIDDDGDLDAFIGEYDGVINFFRNNGTSLAPNFITEGGTNPFGLSDVGSQSRPSFADIDGDGDFDAFIGEEDGIINFFENIGSVNTPEFVSNSNSAPFGLSEIEYISAPTFVDIDSDGDLDAFVGNSYGRIFFFENGPCKSSHQVNHVQLAQDLFISEDTITSEALIRNGRDVTFSASDCMVLDTLFEVHQGATFMGLMDGCLLE